MAFGGGSSGSAALTAHTHNQALAGDGGQLSQTLTDMNGVVLYSEITDNSAAVAVNTADISTNTAAIAGIASVPSGILTIWSGGAIPSGWVTSTPTSSLSNTTQNGGQPIAAAPNARTIIGQQFNTGNAVVGNSPINFTWYLYKEGSPTGTVYSRITNSTGTVSETSTTTLDPSTLNTGSGNATAIEFTFTGNTSMSTGDMVTIEFTGGDNSNRVWVRANESAPVSDSVYRMYDTSGNWSTLSATESATFIINWNLAYIEKS
tara:strand:- start:62 stop:847 length:786 start_codon:yes stop_codon:yes gene_type:complete